MGSQPPSGIHLLRCGVLHGLWLYVCSTMDLHGLQGQPASPWSSPRAAGKSLLQHLDHLLPLLIHWPWCLQSSFSHISSLFYPTVFFPFIITISQRHYHHRWWAWPCTAACLCCSRLVLALSDTGEASGGFSQEPHW